MTFGPRPTICVIDDDDAVRDALSTLLEATGFSVAVFGSAQQFLDALAPGQIGCLVVDLDLPDMDGSELVALLVERRIDLPAILMSGRLHNRRLKDRPPDGVLAVLEKPFSDRQLLEQVEFALRRRAGSFG